MKINLGVGAYRDDQGKPFVLKCVREAETQIYQKALDHEYAAIGGLPAFNKVAQELQLGANSPIISAKRVTFLLFFLFLELFFKLLGCYHSITFWNWSFACCWRFYETFY